ncbi:MAG TPA: fumarylacetoacetate hydrolase family protein [Burkholderiales bacterium]|nr:fumarylacetoacetate hydrolase family protein [Burkholderiales bacterium]
MKICHYNDKQVGAVAGDRVHPLGDTLTKAGHLKAGYTMLDVIERLANEPAAMKCARFTLQSGASLPLASVKLLAPLLNPPAIWAAASNYRAHEAEMRDKMGSYDRTAFSKDDLMAEFFLKPVASLVGPGGPVILPKVSRDVDFECELCAVIGTAARHVPEDKALAHVFGYTILWDFSQRDPWGRGRQNTRNIRKGFDTFTGLGPWIVTRDEIDDPQNLAIRVEQNGAPVMSAHTSDMICSLREHIRFLSAVTTLAPGALISTGTPAGVAKLAPGDRLKGSIERIGEMEVAVEAERP